MSNEAKKAKILAIIAARGYCPMGLYLNVAKEMQAEGLIKAGDTYFAGGNFDVVWVAA